MKRAIFVCVVLIVAIGCQSKITGALQVDGATFAVQQCRSGQVFGFSGIELRDLNGRRLRLLASADGTCTAAIVRGDSATEDRLGPCGQMTLQTQSSRINQIVNVKGHAKLNCEAAGHKVAGDIEFENCH